MKNKESVIFKIIKIVFSKFCFYAHPFLKRVFRIVKS